MNRHRTQHVSLADRVTEQIASQHVTPRSTASIWIEQLGYLSLAAVIFTSAVLLINWVGFQIKATGALDFVAYGADGYLAVLEALPYGFLLLCLLGLAGTLLALRHFDLSYRKPLLVLGGVLVLSLGLGTLLAASGVNETLAEQAEREPEPPTVVHRLYRGTLTVRHHSPRLIIGPVIGQSERQLTIGIPAGRSAAVQTNEQTEYPTGKPLLGDIVRVLVIRRDDSPVARVILLRQPRPQPLTQ